MIHPVTLSDGRRIDLARVTHVSDLADSLAGMGGIYRVKLATHSVIYVVAEDAALINAALDTFNVNIGEKKQ